MKRKETFGALIGCTVFAVAYLINRFSHAIRTAYSAGESFVNMTDLLLVQMQDKPLFLSLHSIDLAATALVLFMLMITILRPNRKFRLGEEHGSARWGTKQDIKPFIDPDWDNNLLLTNTERLTMEKRPRNWEIDRNKNVLVIGGSGSGKTRFFVKPNLLQGKNSLVITDPKGTLIEDTGYALRKMGYDVKTFNIMNAKGMAKSLHYNPFAYIQCEADILKLCNVLITNTNGDGQPGGDKFWRDCETLLYCAFIGYMQYVLPPAERNIATLLQMINMSQAKEEDEGYESPVDLMFKELEAEVPDHFAVLQYKKYKLAAGKTAKSILISCGARLAPFDIKEVRELMAYDELELDKLGEQKTALFIMTSDTDKTFNFIAAMLYSQMFNLLCDKALERYGGALPIHVQCILDEFANIGRIPNFEEIIAVIKSRNISAAVILQSRAQLEGIYEKKAETIIDNCDSFLFLGGKGSKTLEDVVKLIGRQTIDTQSDSRSRGGQRSDGSSWQKTGRELITADELASMPKGKCICHITGLRPFYSDKFKLQKHPRYKLLSEQGKPARTISLPAVDFDVDEEFTYIDTTNINLTLKEF